MTCQTPRASGLSPARGRSHSAKLRCGAIFALSFALVLILVPKVAAQTSAERILVRHPLELKSALKEGLVYTEGELRAVGFLVDFEPVQAPLSAARASAEYVGTLAFEYTGPMITIVAMPPDEGPSLAQAVDPSAAGIGPEVISVRALETLRAGLMQWFKRGGCENRACSKRLVQFLKTGEPELPVAASPPAVEPVQRAERPVPLRFSVWGGAQSLVQAPAGELAWGAVGELFFGKQELSLGLRVTGALSEFQLTTAQPEVGSAQVKRYTAELHAQTRAPLTQALHWYVQGGGGLVAYTVRGDARPGFVAKSQSHNSPVFSAETGVTAELVSSLAVYAGVGLSLASDAPQVRIDSKATGVLDRPMLSLSAGVLLHEFW